MSELSHAERFARARRQREHPRLAEFIVWSHDRRKARLHPDPYADLADDELSPLPLEDTPTDGRFN